MKTTNERCVNATQTQRGRETAMYGNRSCSRAGDGGVGAGATASKAKTKLQKNEAKKRRAGAEEQI